MVQPNLTVIVRLSPQADLILRRRRAARNFRQALSHQKTSGKKQLQASHYDGAGMVGIALKPIRFRGFFENRAAHDRQEHKGSGTFIPTMTRIASIRIGRFGRRHMITKGKRGFKHLNIAWHGSLWLLTAWKISVLRMNNRLVIYWDYKGDISFTRH